MALTREEWLRRIQGVKPHFAGTTFKVPEVGDRVRIIQGEDIGSEFVVLLLQGNVYRTDQRVFVDHPSGTPTWYYPWNLEILPR